MKRNYAVLTVEEAIKVREILNAEFQLNKLFSDDQTTYQRARIFWLGPRERLGHYSRMQAPTTLRKNARMGKVAIYDVTPHKYYDTHSTKPRWRERLSLVKRYVTEGEARRILGGLSLSLPAGWKIDASDIGGPSWKRSAA